MWNRLRSIWTIGDLRNKILFTIGMLLIFRVMAYIPVPGIDPSSLSKFLNSSSNKNLNQLFGLLDVFSGGSLKTFSVVSMGLYPYITSSIVMQLLQPIVPRRDALSPDGEAVRNRLSHLTPYIAVPPARC